VETCSVQKRGLIDKVVVTINIPITYDLFTFAASDICCYLCLHRTG